MRDRITTFLVVTLVTITIWLFAEAESVGHAATEARVELGAADSSKMIRPTDWDGRVTIDLTGSKWAIERARELLDRPLKVAPPATLGDGVQKLDLLEMLEQCETLRNAGVSIESVRPLSASVEVISRVVRSVPVRAVLPGVQVQGEVDIAPASIELKLPRELAAKLGDGLFVTAKPTKEQLARLPETGPASVSADLSLPEALAGEKNVDMQTGKVQLSFSVKSTLASAPVSFPVQVLTLPIEWSDWTVKINDEDQLLPGQVNGPADAVERIKSGEDRAIAVLALSSDDLAKRLTTKEVGFAAVHAGVIGPLPAGVEVKTEKRMVRFTVKKRGEP